MGYNGKNAQGGVIPITAGEMIRRMAACSKGNRHDISRLSSAGSNGSIVAREDGFFNRAPRGLDLERARLESLYREFGMSQRAF